MVIQFITVQFAIHFIVEKLIKFLLNLIFNCFGNGILKVTVKFSILFFKVFGVALTTCNCYQVDVSINDVPDAVPCVKANRNLMRGTLEAVSDNGTHSV